MITIYTDGGNSAKNKVGGCAAIVCREEMILKELSQGYHNNPTNNQMELAGVLMGLEYVLYNPELGKDVTIISDSEYVVKGASNWLPKWKRKNWRSTQGKVKNQVQWIAIDKLKEELNITWKWCKGHANNTLNNLADRLAVSAYKKFIC